MALKSQSFELDNSDIISDEYNFEKTLNEIKSDIDDLENNN